MYVSTKTYPHSCGFSVAFRQHAADSHCRFLHGYALKVQIRFGARALDDRNWVVDFGGLRHLKDQLSATFDHKTLVAKDDPDIDLFEKMAARGVADVLIVERTGCEAMAQLVYRMAYDFLERNNLLGRVRVLGAEVWEHEGNSAAFTGGE